MKINKLCFLKHKFYFVKFLKNSVYNVQKKIIVLNIFLKLIYKFNNYNKKILFLANDSKFLNFFDFLKQKTNHLFLFTQSLIKGLFSNFLVFKYFYLQQNFLFNVKFKTDVNLIVMLLLQNSKFKSELLKSNVLFVTFNGDNANRQLFYQFNVLNKTNINLIFLLIYEILQ